MMDTRIVPRDLQHKFADQVRKGQENMNGAIRAWKDAAQSMRPQLPELSESLSAKLPGREMLIANAHDLAEQFRMAQRRIADQVREAAEPWAKQVHQVRKAAAPLAEQVRHAGDPWVKQMHDYRKAAAPLAEQIRHAGDPWVKQMHQVRKAAAPLTDQVRKAAAPLHGRQQVTPATVTGQPSAPSAKAAPAPETSRTKTATTRKPRSAKK